MSLCTMCMFGVTAKIDGKPTGAVWWCGCGESHCRHIYTCPKCGKTKREVADRQEALAKES